jgi:glycosyltransferase involved in cell wall biosynthesis
VIASEHTAVEHYLSRPLQFRLVRWSARWVARVTVPSEKISQGFPTGIRGKMVVIPNPVPRRERAWRRSRKDGQTLLALGAFREEKGHGVLVSAFAQVAARFPGWTLRLVGEGPCRETIERQVAKLGLVRRVVFAGAVANVAREYASADLFVMPSTYESFGLATAEALAYGLPAVGFADCPGTNELIADGVNGVLVSGEDRPAALAAGLERLMEDGDLRRRLGGEGPASVERFSLESVTRSWELLIVTVAGPSRGARMPSSGAGPGA